VPSAKSVLTRADSALARVAELGREETPVAPTPDYTPRTPWGSTYVPQPDLSEYATFQAALGAYNGKRYEDAIALFSQVVNSGRPPEMVPNAYYWMGESLYAEGRYAESMPYFEYVTRVGPNYKRDMSMYKLSRANLHLGNRSGANLWYERLRNEYPRSSYIATLRRLGAR
jgi:TolA-binding protein